MSIYVIGTGDHARVIAELLQAADLPVAAFVEPDLERRVTDRLPAPVLRGLDRGAAWLAGDAEFVVAVGGNELRRRLFATCLELGLRPRAVVHPSATLLGGATVDPGAQVCARALVGVDARIGPDVIVNTMASLDHDVVVAGHAFVAPGVRLAGRVHVGEGAHLGIGAIVREGTKIGAGALVAAGAVVVADVDPGARVAGVPARPMDPHVDE